MGEVNLFDVEGTTSGELHGNGIEIHINGQADEFSIALPTGEKGILMVRPEFVQFVLSGETSDFIVRGILRAEYALGSRIQYEVETSDGTKLTVENLREDRYQGAIRDSVILGWDIESTHMIRE